jgi:ABC-type transport system substrate-binding protein
MSQKPLSLIVLSMLCMLTVVSVFSFAAPLGYQTSIPVATAATGSCPTSNTITFVTEPIPQSLNMLAPSGDSTFMVASLEYLTLAPFPLEPNGSLDWTDSLTNWITTNSNYTQWTFHIAPNMMWSNGTAVTASDIKTWLSPTYALDPNYDFVGLHTEVTGVQVVNSDTAIVMLNQSDAQLPNRIGMEYYSPMVSPTDVAKGPSDPLFATPAIADGPWYLANYTSGGTTAVMLPNPYWPGAKPTACALDIHFVENSAELIPFLASNQADFAGPLAFGSIAGLQSYSNIHLNTHGGNFGSFIMYNITRYPYNMTEFRQALAYALNTSAIMQQAVFGYGSQANIAQGGMPDSFGSYNQNQAMYPYSVTKAMSLLYSIGFTGGGAPGVPLLFPNGTKYSVTLYTDTNKAWDPSLEIQVASYLTNIGINVQTQTLTSANLAADYSTNAFNIQNNLVIYSSGGPQYYSPWLSAQQDCNVYGTPGCYNWFAQTTANGSPHEEWPPFADAWYQSNLTAIDNTPATNINQQIHYFNNIQAIRAQYLPLLMLGYPQKIFAYNTAKWANWPSYYQSNELSINLTMFSALRPAGSVSTSSHTTTSSSSPSQSNTGTSSITQSSSASSSMTESSSSTTTSSNAGTLELVAGVVLVVIIIGGAAVYMLRRRPPAART